MGIVKRFCRQLRHYPPTKMLKEYRRNGLRALMGVLRIHSRIVRGKEPF